jgi:CubicO group peptidase (beta-lactamase class C family)
MEIDKAAASEYDFSAARAAMQRHVDRELLAGISHAVLRGRKLVEVACAGWADREQRVPLATEHLFRIFSSTKLVTSCAALLLWEEGRFALDDPIERYLPQLGRRRVLKPGATHLDDAEPARSPITIRHLMSHSSGLSLGLLDPGTLIFNAYAERGVRDRNIPLAGMIDALADLPLVFHPGTAWEYSMATDVLGRLVEVLSGQALDTFFTERIFGPLGMDDTSFVVPAAKAHRLVACYLGADPADPMKPGLTRSDDYPYPGAYLRPIARLSGGGGLVSSLPDMVSLVRSLLPGGPTLLKPDTIELMMQNQLPANVWVQFLDTGVSTGLGHGLAGAVAVAPVANDPAAQIGEVRWGGIAGTQWWISPRSGIAVLMMAQRQMAFWHPFALEFKRLAYQAMRRGVKA